MERSLKIASKANINMHQKGSMKGLNQTELAGQAFMEDLGGAAAGAAAGAMIAGPPGACVGGIAGALVTCYNQYYDEETY